MTPKVGDDRKSDLILIVVAEVENYDGSADAIGRHDVPRRPGTLTPYPRLDLPVEPLEEDRARVLSVGFALPWKAPGFEDSWDQFRKENYEDWIHDNISTVGAMWVGRAGVLRGQLEDVCAGLDLDAIFTQYFLEDHYRFPLPRDFDEADVLHIATEFLALYGLPEAPVRRFVHRPVPAPKHAWVTAGATRPSGALP